MNYTFDLGENATGLGYFWLSLEYLLPVALLLFTLIGAAFIILKVRNGIHISTNAKLFMVGTAVIFLGLLLGLSQIYQ